MLINALFSVDEMKIIPHATGENKVLPYYFTILCFLPRYISGSVSSLSLMVFA
jgi:hypothetical protein